MLNFFHNLWTKITFPFRWLGNLIARPFRAVYRYFSSEPTSLPVVDAMAAIVTEASARQSLIDHIEKFRGHLLRSLVAIILASSVAWIYRNPLIELLARPIGGIEALHIIDLTEGVAVNLKVTILAGVAISIIYVAFEFWFYAAPGLTPRERLVTFIGIPLSAIFFWLGVAFTYKYMLPPAVEILISFGNFQSSITAENYFSLITRLMLWIGLFFEFPLVTTILSRIRWITPQALTKQWRLAMVIIGIIAAVITPTTDIGSMLLVMAPMVGLYFISIILSYIVYPRKQEETPQA